MSDVYTIELERRVQDMAYQLEHLAAEMTRLSQQVPKAYGSGDGRGGGGETALMGLVTTAVPTGTPGSPSTAGYVQLYRGGAASGSPISVKNGFTLAASIAIGKAVAVASIGGSWYVIAADC